MAVVHKFLNKADDFRRKNIILREYGYEFEGVTRWVLIVQMKIPIIFI